MINSQHIRFGALTAVLLLSTVMLITIDESQSSVFAQNSNSTLTNAPITPSSDTLDSDDDPSSSSNESDNNEANDESSSTSGTGTDDDEDDANNNNDSEDDSDSEQDTTPSEDVEEEQQEVQMENEFQQTNPLLEQIRNSVNGALSATGITP